MVGMGITDSVRRTISTRQTCILYYIHTRILSIRLRRSRHSRRPSRPRRVILSLFVYYYYFICTQSEADLNS
jgi:hypothetical protein